jgi:Rrf2 family iron-responsive transcriptional regulator
VHALVYLARHADTSRTASHHMARADGMPVKFLLKVLGPLADAGVLDSLKGRHGGFCLACPAQAITLLEIVEAVEEQRRAEAPQASKEAARDQQLQAVCEDVAKAVRPVLAGVTLADLAATKKTGTQRKGGARVTRLSRAMPWTGPSMG